MGKIKPLEQKTFMADVDEGDAVRFTCKSGMEKVGFLTQKGFDIIGYICCTFSRNYPSQDYSKEYFTLELDEGRRHHLRLKPYVDTKKETTETAMQYQVLYKRKKN